MSATMSRCSPSNEKSLHFFINCILLKEDELLLAEDEGKPETTSSDADF